MRRLAAVAAVAVVACLLAVVGASWWLRGASEVLTAPSASAVAAHRAGLPDPRLTPGAVNAAVTPATLGSTICTVGWTKTVRPPAAYTGALKVAQIVEYGYADRRPSQYQEDHLVPLELGGAPRDPRNLWPQPNDATLPDGTRVGAAEKDDLEDELRREVCAGTRDLRDAQRAIAGDWVQAWIDAGRP